MSVRRRRGVTIIFPDYKGDVNAVIKAFMRRGGEIIRNRAWGKIGSYQAGWAPLAASTLRKKRGSLKRMGKRSPWIRYSAGGADNPLIDTGKMGNSIKVDRVTSREATVGANFPMGQHEQDMEVAEFHIPTNIPLPARPVMWPAMEESMPQILDELETRMAGAL